MTSQVIITNECVAAFRAITENEPALSLEAVLTVTEREELASISHPVQRTEWLACRVIVRQLVEAQGVPYWGLQKDEFGKPHLLNSTWSISLSHTAGWAAAVLHRSRPVGIDIEPIRDQFRRVVPRVLSESEIAHAAGDPNRLAVYWCAKEALYKRYGKRQLTFREHLHVEPFTDQDEQLVGHVRLPDHAERVLIRCLRTGPGLLAVAY